MNKDVKYLKYISNPHTPSHNLTNLTLGKIYKAIKIKKNKWYLLDDSNFRIIFWEKSIFDENLTIDVTTKFCRKNILIKILK